MGVGCPCPPVRNDIVTPRHLLSFRAQVLVWNETVANLTLMALGSSAPEILLAIIEQVQKLGPKPDPEVEHLEHFKQA